LTASGATPPLPRDAAARPFSLTLAAWAFILVGAGSILKDVVPLVGPDHASALRGLLAEGGVGLSLIWSLRALAVVGGVFVLRGRAWARWLLAAWMIFHVGISMFHSIGEVAAHVVIFAVLSWALFRPPASRYFAGMARVGRTT